eukprot:SAG11_NODE_2555_length_3224_cov_2.896640_2_plen_44_part_00
MRLLSGGLLVSGREALRRLSRPLFRFPKFGVLEGLVEADADYH